jgi:hypothetical protein
MSYTVYLGVVSGCVVVSRGLCSYHGVGCEGVAVVDYPDVGRVCPSCAERIYQYRAAEMSCGDNPYHVAARRREGRAR